MSLSVRRIFCTPRASRTARKRRGSTAVEMALITPIFFLLLVGTTEIALVETAQQLLEHATYNASRLAKTGYAPTGQTASEAVSQTLTKELQSFGSFIDTSKVTMSSTAYTNFSGIGGAGTSGLGTAQQIVVYTVTYPWTLFTPMMGHIIGNQDSHGNWIVNLTSRIVVRNEPY